MIPQVAFILFLLLATTAHRHLVSALVEPDRDSEELSDKSEEQDWPSGSDTSESTSLEYSDSLSMSRAKSSHSGDSGHPSSSDGPGLAGYAGLGAIIPPSMITKPVLDVSRISIQCFESLHVDIENHSSFPYSQTSVCPALVKLHLEYTPMGFLCRTCKGFIRPKSFLEHLSAFREHPSFNRIFPSERTTICDHILASHRVPTTAMFPLPDELPSSITGLPVYPCHQCKEPGCAFWMKARTDNKSKQFRSRLSEHYHGRDAKHPGLPIPRNPVFRYVIRPYGQIPRTEPDHLWVIKLPEGWTPGSEGRSLAGSSGADEYASAPSAPFLLELGWPQFIQKTNAALNILLQISSYPSRRQYAEIDSQDQRFYASLFALSSLIPGYLIDGNRYAFSVSPDIRRILTCGSKATFRRLDELTYANYARPLQRTMGLLLWISHLMMTRGKDHLKTIVGSMPILTNLSREQLVILSSMYQMLMSPERLEPLQLLALLHNFLVALVKHKITSADRFACATDYTLCLGSLLPTGRFQFANSITRMLRSEKLPKFIPYNAEHWGRIPLDKPMALLGGEDGNDEAGLKGSGADELVDEEEQDEVADQIDEDVREAEAAFNEPLDATGCIASVETPATLLDLFDADVNQNELESTKVRDTVGVNLMKYLHENSSWVQPFPTEHSTPYTHMKLVWATAAPTARRESNDSRFTCSRRGEVISVRISNGSTIDIPFSSLKIAAMTSIAECQRFIIDALPSDCKCHYDNFNWTTLTDNLMDKESLFRQHANSSTFNQIINHVRKSLFSTGASRSVEKPQPLFDSATGTHHHATIISWINADLHIQHALCASLVQSMGVPPRDFQVPMLQYDHDSDTDSWRNVFMLDGALALGNPKAKQIDKNVQECVWQVAPSLAKPLAFYLGVLRPLVIEFLTVLQSSAYHPYHRRFIFVHNSIVAKSHQNRSASSLWNGTIVNTALQRSTSKLPIRLTCRFLRDLITALLRVYFPKLLPSVTTVEETAMDKQGQHTKATSDTHYGRSGNVLRTLRMHVAAATQYMQVSRAHQVILGLIEFDEETQNLYGNPLTLTTERQRSVALSIARTLVCHCYRLGGQNTKADNIKLVEEVLSSAPYFGCTEAFSQPSGSIGDNVLEQVLRGLIFGFSGPTPMSIPLPGGCTAEEIAVAIREIVKAVEEWRSGEFQQITEADIVAKIHFDEVKARACKILDSWRNEKPDKWSELTARVYTGTLSTTHIAIPVASSWPLRGLPQLRVEEF
ncbi:hypothetical protein BJ138DRAFT_1106998 [Hygrophoropsis aurantiaca]|uniref:Uncharacterized protein n=1 Tax=Hygrophoropsis aurantiaca TaxID=72124 RepID=A0ACB7ZU61_9AGAM|nr:hypothetical protein BJ138DRAFT_1106998 [Hygrophoropsis aurantiaca]